MSNKFVGPFFYMNSKVVALKIDIDEGEKTGDFINHPKSHFDFFNEIKIDPLDDYGHYPRGRVVYNSKTRQFYVYVDRTIIHKKEVIKELLKIYNLDKDNVIIKRDLHYGHDCLWGRYDKIRFIQWIN